MSSRGATIAEAAIARLNGWLAGLASRAQRTGRRFWRALNRRWRGSLMLRVVATTIALGLAVLLVVGQFLLETINKNLVDSARTSAQNDAMQQVQLTTSTIRQNNFDNTGSLRSHMAQRLKDMRGPADAPLRSVALRKAIGTGSGQITDSSYGFQANSIPPSLREALAKQPDRLVSQQLTLPIFVSDGSTVQQPAMVVGKLIELGATSTAGSRAEGLYELYFVYPLERESQILADIRRTFLMGALAMVSLIALIAWVVTRQVVDPVRQAVLAAEELASGQLDKRIMVSGEDDLARLGRAFNEMAASLERQIEQLRELSRVQRRFVSDVSHELRTPLTTIRMAGEVIHEARDGFDPALARTAELLQTQLDRFEELLSDLLEISRFDAGAAVLDSEQIDVRAIVHQVVDALSPLAERKGTVLTVDAPHSAVLTEVDPRRIQRILRNLVDNAIEHGEGRPVEIRIASDDDAVAIGVRDHGTGLEPAALRRVFDRFWRADPARARHTGGTGLGLAISLEDAHLHGGWLQVWGAPGQGAHFRLTLPRVAGKTLTGSPLPLSPSDAAAMAGRNVEVADVAR